jgi:hypothetical protein
MIFFGIPIDDSYCGVSPRNVQDDGSPVSSDATNNKSNLSVY